MVWLFPEDNAWSEVLKSRLTNLAVPVQVCYLKTVSGLCLQLGDATSNLQPCHEFVFLS
jgi:hypothetical protein